MTAPARKRKCRYCGEYRRTDRGEIINGGFYCNTGHAIRYAQENAAKARAKQQNIERRAFKAETRKRRAKLNENNHKWQTAETQRAFNEFIRLLDAGQPCISCGRARCGHTWDCGHFLTVAAHPELRFDPRNAFLQGSTCNRPTENGRGKNPAQIRIDFEQGIIRRCGMGHLVWLNSHHPAKHYTCPELADLRAMFRAESSRLKKGLEPSREWRALPKDFNNSGRAAKE